MDRQTRLDLKRLARKLDRARTAEAETWDELRDMMKKAHEEEGGTFSEIGEVVGVTKARVYQIVTGKRGGRKKPGLGEDVLDTADDEELASASA